MRPFLMMMLTTAPFMATAADAVATAAVDEVKPVNTVCVICGKPVDSKVTPIPEIASNGKKITIGCCSDVCANEVRKTPYLYVDAATQNKKFNSPVGQTSATPAHVR